MDGLGPHIGQAAQRIAKLSRRIQPGRTYPASKENDPEYRAPHQVRLFVLGGGNGITIAYTRELRGLARLGQARSIWLIWLSGLSGSSDSFSPSSLSGSTK